MPGIVEVSESDGLGCHGGLLLSSPGDLPAVCGKRSRVAFALRFSADSGIVEPTAKQQRRRWQQRAMTCSLDSLPDECLFEILRRLPGDCENAAACVSRRWLSILTSIRHTDQILTPLLHLTDVNAEAPEEHPGSRRRGYRQGACASRTLEGHKATDIRLAAIAVGAGSFGSGLGELFIRGSHPTRGVTDYGLSSIARRSPSLRVLSLWSVPMVTDAGLAETASSCHMLGKLDIVHCRLISDEGLASIAKNCPNLTSLTLDSCPRVSNQGLLAIGRYCSNLASLAIKNCPLVGDHGVSTIVISTAASLTRIKLENLDITDMSLAILGYYGKAVTSLTLTKLRAVGERGFWVMANAAGLRSLKFMTITSCSGATDLSIAATAKCCPSLKQMSIRECPRISDVGLKALAEYAKVLQNLHLEECNEVTLNGVLDVFCCCAKLKTLALVKCPGIGEFPSCPLQFPRCNSLRSLSISACAGFSDASLGVIGMICPQLEQISLTELAAITDRGLAPLIRFAGRRLAEVNLSGCSGLTDATVAALATTQCSTLRLLSLGGCTKITDESLLSIVDSCLVLQELDLSSCSVTDYGVAVLASARELELSVLSFAGCSMVTEKSLPLLGNMGFSLAGLNLQRCNLNERTGVSSLEEKLWWCDILS